MLFRLKGMGLKVACDPSRETPCEHFDTLDNPFAYIFYSVVMVVLSNLICQGLSTEVSCIVV